MGNNISHTSWTTAIHHDREERPWTDHRPAPTLDELLGRLGVGDNVVWQAPAPADIEPFAYWLLERDAHPPTLRSQLADITQVILDLDTTATQPAERARADLRRQQQRPPPFETNQPELLRILEDALELQQ